ncbi:unnamed protein product, partial [Durusdinium trenchii]
AAKEAADAQQARQAAEAAHSEKESAMSSAAEAKNLGAQGIYELPPTLRKAAEEATKAAIDKADK